MPDAADGRAGLETGEIGRLMTFRCAEMAGIQAAGKTEIRSNNKRSTPAAAAVAGLTQAGNKPSVFALA
jgi:hypothetical protein